MTLGPSGPSNLHDWSPSIVQISRTDNPGFINSIRSTAEEMGKMRLGWNTNDSRMLATGTTPRDSSMPDSQEFPIGVTCGCLTPFLLLNARRKHRRVPPL